MTLSGHNILKQCKGSWPISPAKDPDYFVDVRWVIRVPASGWVRPHAKLRQNHSNFNIKTLIFSSNKRPSFDSVVKDKNI